MGADAAECGQPNTSPPPSAVNARAPVDILSITAAAATGEFIVCTQFMITMAISGRHGHAPVAGVIPLEFRLLLLISRLRHDRGGTNGRVRRAALRCSVAGHDSSGALLSRAGPPVGRRSVVRSIDSSVVGKFDLTAAASSPDRYTHRARKIVYRKQLSHACNQTMHASTSPHSRNQPPGNSDRSH